MLQSCWLRVTAVSTGFDSSSWAAKSATRFRSSVACASAHFLFFGPFVLFFFCAAIRHAQRTQLATSIQEQSGTFRSARWKKFAPAVLGVPRARHVSHCFAFGAICKNKHRRTTNAGSVVASLVASLVGSMVGSMVGIIGSMVGVSD